MTEVKLSVSLSDDDVARLDRYLKASGLPSRSAAIQRAIRLLSAEHLEADYEDAVQEWEDSPDRALWEGVSADGIL